MNLIGIPIGFYGYLLPGNINLMVLELYRTRRYKLLFFVLFLILFFESLYCILALHYLNEIKGNNTLLNGIKFVTYSLLFLMGAWMILEWKKSKTTVHKSTIMRGLLSVVINPQQIPFWLFMGILFSPIINFGNDIYTSSGFLLCNAIGTLSAMIIYMIYGSKLINYFCLNLSIINRSIGFLYVFMSIFSFWKLLI